MKRRNLLVTMGVLSAGGAVATGTGAFTSAEADRDVTVAVADDASAFLAISDTGNANKEYVTEDNGEFGLDLTGSNSTSGGGAGVNADAVTVFRDLFEIRNQGTQDIDVEVDPLTFVDTSSGTTLIVLVVPDTDFPTTTISTGSAETYHMVVDVYSGGTAPDVSDTITITGEAP
jgi:hypothetical protein